MEFADKLAPVMLRNVPNRQVLTDHFPDQDPNGNSFWSGFYALVMLIEPMREFFELDLPPAEFIPVMIGGMIAGALGIYFLPKLLPWGRALD